MYIQVKILPVKINRQNFQKETPVVKRPKYVYLGIETKINSPALFNVTIVAFTTGQAKIKPTS